MKTITALRILYPLWAIIGMFSLLYAPTLAADTFLFKLGILGQILVQLFQIAVALLLYKFFEKTDKNQASLMVIFALIAVPLSLMAILNPDAIHLAEIFWGLWLIPMGTLVIRSKLFPKFLGYLLYVGAFGYLGAPVFFFLTGKVPLFTEILTVGELIWLLWITFMGTRKIRA